MQHMIDRRVQELRQRQAQIEQELATLAQRQQDLVQEALRLQGALRELEGLVVAVPVVIPEGD